MITFIAGTMLGAALSLFAMSVIIQGILEDKT